MKKEDIAIKRILENKPPERKIMISTADTSEAREKVRRDREEQSKAAAERLEMFKEFRVPLTCPVCKRNMRKKLDSKFWRLRRKCMDCAIKDETRMRIDGTWENYEKSIVLNNKLSYIKDQIESIKEWKKSPIPEFQNQVAADGVTMDKEKWSANVEKLNELADSAIQDLVKLKKEVESELQKVQ